LTPYKAFGCNCKSITYDSFYWWIFFFGQVGAGFMFLKKKQRMNGGERVKLRTLPYFQASNFNMEVEHPTTHCIKEVLIIT
jgi:hypothetical protein